MKFVTFTDYTQTYANTMSKKQNLKNTISIIASVLGILTYLGLKPGVLLKYVATLNNTVIIRGIIGLLTLLLILLLICFRIHKYFIPEPTRNLEDLAVPFLLEKGTYKTSESKYKFRMFLYYGVIFTQYAVIACCILVAINYVLNNKIF
jgi:hypothetical protein